MRVVLDVIRVRKIDRLRGENEDWGGVLGERDLNDEGDRVLDETHQSTILNGGGCDGWGITLSVLLSAIDEHEDIASPVDL